jgi:hypothetical protein
MQRQEPASVGILPIGALGVAFFHHLTARAAGAAGSAAFLSRRPSAEERWHRGSSVRIETAAGLRDLPLESLLCGNLPEAAAAGKLPGIILVCTNPDQLFGVVSDYVAVVEHEHRLGRLEAGAAALPLLVLCSNGIYFQRVRSSFVELLEESTLLGRLPDLWPDLMPGVVGRLMRGVTIQTALRSGAGSSAAYRPGPPGRTQLAGGDRGARAAASRLLTSLGGWFEDAGDATPTRVEFNKALVNLAMNVLGQLAAIGPAGEFRPLTVGEIAQRVPETKVLELVEAVTAVGRGVGVYRPGETAAEVLAELRLALKPTGTHVPSSLQWLEQQLASGTLQPGLAPTEKWLIEPLQQYARSLGDERTIEYFEGLERELVAATTRAGASARAR